MIVIGFGKPNLKNNENKTIDNNFSLPPPRITTPAITHTNPYLNLILKEVIYIVKISKELECNKYKYLVRKFKSTLFNIYDRKYRKKCIHKTRLFVRCLIDLIVNKPEVISYMVGEMCENKIMEDEVDNRLDIVWIRLLYTLSSDLRFYIKLFNPQSIQISFITEPCYELGKKSIYDLKNIITKFISNKEEDTLNKLYPIQIDGIEKFLESYTYPLEGILTEIVKNYWIHKLPKLIINREASTLKVTPKIWRFTKKVLQFHKNFYMKINKEFEEFECKNMDEENNIVPFIYYFLSVRTIESLVYMLETIYAMVFVRFTNWYKFAKFFVYPFYEIYDDFCKKLIINKKDNKLKLYKYFSYCDNERLIESIWYWGEKIKSNSINYKFNYMNVPSLEDEDKKWVYVKNKLLEENLSTVYEWIEYFKDLQS